MKFLRDIISERSDSRPEGGGRADRTMTRLSSDIPTDGDDIFRRLMAEEPLVADSPHTDDDDNLFGEEDDVQTDAPLAEARDDAQLDTEALLRRLHAQTATPTERAGNGKFDTFSTPSPEQDLDTTYNAEPAHFIRRSKPPAPLPAEEPTFDIEEEPVIDAVAQAVPVAPRQPETARSATPPPRPAPPDPAPQSISAEPAPAPQASFGGMPGRSARGLKARLPLPDATEPSPRPATPAASAARAQEDMVSVPAPATGRSGRGAGRVKTRLLGFGNSDALDDPFALAAGDAPAMEPVRFPVGWLVVVDGPGRGASFALRSGVSQIGRGEDQAVRLDFGDTAISRSNHAAMAYDAERGKFYFGYGGKANMVRVNDRPVLSTEEIQPGATIHIGETVLRFIALCDDTFNWTQDGTNHDDRHG